MLIDFEWIEFSFEPYSRVLCTLTPASIYYGPLSK